MVCIFARQALIKLYLRAPGFDKTISWACIKNLRDFSLCMRPKWLFLAAILLGLAASDGDGKAGTTAHGATLLGQNLASTVGRYGTFTFPLTDTMVGLSLHLYGEWSEHEVSLFSVLVQPGDVVFDIGANIGAFTVPFGRLVGHDGSVTAVEAQPALFDILRSNVMNNALDGVVHARNAVVGEKMGDSVEVPIVDYSVPGNFGSFSVKGTASSTTGHQEEPQLKLFPVSSVTIDELYRENSRCPSFIKVDVEGMESAVLAGARRTLRDCESVLYMENNCRETSEALLELLIDDIGYTVYWSVHPYFNEANYRGHKHDVFTDALVSMNILAVPTSLSRTLDIVNFVQVQKTAGYRLEDYMLQWKNSSAIIKQHKNCGGG